jgi:hypothetical protein
MTDRGAARGELIRYLVNALAIAYELEDGTTGSLIEQALEQARSQRGEHRLCHTVVGLGELREVASELGTPGDKKEAQR